MKIAAIIACASYFLVAFGYGCVDTDNGATDANGYSCVEYDKLPEWCGKYDDDDFNSNSMCCACGGGGTMGGYASQVHPVVWGLCLCPPFLIAAFMLMRDGLASFFPW